MATSTIKPHPYNYHLAAWASKLSTKPLYPDAEEASERKPGSLSLTLERSNTFNIGNVTFKGFLNDPADRKVSLTLSHADFLLLCETIITFSNEDATYKNAERVEWDIEGRTNPITGKFDPKPKVYFSLFVCRDKNEALCFGFKIPNLSKEIYVSQFIKPATVKLPKLRDKEGVVSDMSPRQFSNLAGRAWATKYKMVIPDLCSTLSEPAKWEKPNSVGDTELSPDIKYDDLE